MIVVGIGVSATQIEDWHDLNDIRDDLTGNYTLVNDLDSGSAGYETYNNGSGWDPIGEDGDGFKGTFDGNQHIISDLYINRPDEDNVGLFGLTDQAGVRIRNVGVENVNITGRNYVGTLLGQNHHGQRVRTTYATGRITGQNYVGGLIGSSNPGAQLENSYARVDVTGNNSVGGLEGEKNQGSKTDKSYSTGSIDGEDEVGGLVGTKSGGSDVTNSFWDTNTSGQDSSAGGTGKNTEEMKNVSTFTNLDTDGLGDPWDFVGDPYDDTGNEDIWDIDEEEVINDGYPYLRWEEEEIEHPPIADFIHDPETPKAHELVEFTDESDEGDVEILEWEWDFGDGQTSTEQDPRHIYTSEGDYTVELTVTDANDLSDTITREITVGETEEEPPNANFEYSPEQPGINEEIQFTDQSEQGDEDIVGWEWRFNDGTTSTEQNPTHIYSETDTYTVELTVTDENNLSSIHNRDITVQDEDDEDEEPEVIEGTPVEALTLPLALVIFVLAVLFYLYKLKIK